MAILSQFAIPVVLLALTLAFGFWLSHLGKPYNALLFNVHKLVALGAVILAVVQLTKIPNLLTPFPLVAVGLALAALALFVSGALMSAGKLDYALMRAIHRAGIGATVIALFFILRLGQP